MKNTRRNIIIFAIVLVSVVYSIRLFMLQVADDSYKAAATNNAIEKVLEYPYRGLIYDRNGKLLVTNVPVFDIMVVPAELPDTLDEEGICHLFDIDKPTLHQKIESAKDYSQLKPSPFLKQLPLTEFAKIQEQLVFFPGFRILPRTIRGYPHQSLANALGYIGEISSRKLDQLKAQGNKFYKSGDYIGISGLEAFYEEQLRGKRGVRYYLVDVHGTRKGSFKNGKFDTLAVAGQNIVTTVDLNLQQYAEKLMKNKRGSIVAIEPATGEILAFVSSPSYNPNLLTGRNFGNNFAYLSRQKNRPLFNRPLMAMYPPGSTFKVLQALIAQHLGIVDSNRVFSPYGSFFDCHFCQPADMYLAVRYSSNPYCEKTFRRIINQNKVTNTYEDSRLGLTQWRNLISHFGVGKKLGTDLPDQKKGILPTVEYYDKVYGEKRWKYSNIHSLSIGQGELGIVPLQLANIAAIIANRGYYIIPHFVKVIGNRAAFTSSNSASKMYIPKEYKQKIELPIDQGYYSVVINGMQGAVEGGTVWWPSVIPDITICGKTGTAQNPHGDDHSVFIAFAPKNNPKIAIAVFVENGGYGGSVAAPIASLVIEKHIRGEITKRRQWLEDVMVEKNLMGEPEKDETPIEATTQTNTDAADTTSQPNL